MNAPDAKGARWQGAASLASVIRRAILGVRRPALRRIERKLSKAIQILSERARGPLPPLGPRPSEAEIAAFEARHGIRLPDGHRDFILYLGDGLPGPHGRLARLPSGTGELVRHARLDQPSLLHSGCEPLPNDQALLLRGALVLGHIDDHEPILLLVSGEHRGRVVYVDVTRGTSFFPEDPDFLRWYERWLDELLAGCKMESFGRTMPGFEPELVEAIRGRRRLADALRALARLPSIRPETLALLESFLDDDDDTIRDAAVTAHLACVWPPSEILRPRLRDPVVEIRRRIVFYVEVARLTTWFDELRPLIDDADPEIASRALSILRDEVSFDELVARLGDPRPELRSRATSLLTNRDDPRVPAIALGFLREGSYEVVLSGVCAFLRFPYVEARADLDALTRGPFRDLRALACVALARQDHDAGQAALMELCGDEDPYLRADAVCHLAAVGDMRALPTLQGLLADATVPPSERSMPPVLCIFPVQHFARRAIDMIIERCGDGTPDDDPGES